MYNLIHASASACARDDLRGPFRRRRVSESLPLQARRSLLDLECSAKALLLFLSLPLCIISATSRIVLVLYHRNRVAPILQSLRFARGIQFARSIRKPSKRKLAPRSSPAVMLPLPHPPRSLARSRERAKLALKRRGCSEGRNNVVGRSYLSFSVSPPPPSSSSTLSLCYSLSDRTCTTAAGKR